ncbi:MAG: glycosyltransferase family 4 protein [Planctomycetes bacterium]|nr:glycosyltransferase family 4 protein [Planctomycetota bacterium]
MLGRPLSILMVSPNLWFEGRSGVGMPVFWWETAGYARAGHRVTLCLYDERREDASREGGMDLVRFRVPGTKWGSRAGRVFDGVRGLEYLAPAACRAAWLAAYTGSALRRAAGLARPGRYDLVHAHSHWSVPAGWLLARRARVPLVVRYYGAEDLGVHAREPLLAWKYPDRFPAFRLPAARIVMTDDGSWDPAIARAFGASEARVVCLRNGVDHALGDATEDRAACRRALGLPEGLPVVLSLSRLAPEKRVEVPLRALAAVRGAWLVIAGEGGERRRLEALARALGLAGRVRFLGALHREGVKRALGASDVLVSAYRTANYSNHLWEAMAAGLPAVVADQGQGARYVQDGTTGVLVPDGGGEDALRRGFEGALAGLLADPVRRAAMGRAARAWALRELPSWEARVRQGEAIFREVLEEWRAA